MARTNVPLLRNLESIHGIDISFDVKTGVKGSKDVRASSTDFVYAPGLVSLCEELQRMFDLTPLGSFVDDPTYGINWEWLGKPADVRVAVTLTRLEVKRALEHPSFKSRMKVRRVDAAWHPHTPNAVWVRGVLEVFGFESVELMSFGPYALRYLLLDDVRNFGG